MSDDGAGLQVRQTPRKRTGELSVADFTMLVRVPGRPALVRVYTDEECDEASRYAASPYRPSTQSMCAHLWPWLGHSEETEDSLPCEVCKGCCLRELGRRDRQRGSETRGVRPDMRHRDLGIRGWE